MMRIVCILALATMLGCTAADQDAFARDAAKRAVRPVVADVAPGVPTEPAVDCVIDNATRSEVLNLAADAVTGATASTLEMVAQISTRPAVTTCFAKEYVGVLVDGIAK